MKNSEIVTSINELINPYTNEVVNFEQYLVDIIKEDKKIIIQQNYLGDNDEYNKQFYRKLIKKLKIDLLFESVKIAYVEDEKPTEVCEYNGKYIAIMSGKGGVGKSNVTVNLAKSLNKMGKKVAIIDADIYGYSIPQILNLYDEPEVIDEKIIPLKTKEGIEVISTQYFIADNENKAIVWRAPMLLKLMKNFFKEVKYSLDIEYFLIDMPPGTGDVTLNLTQFVDEVNAIIVTTPNDDASHVAIRAGLLAQELNFTTMGVVENMSYYSHNDDNLFIFGKDGGKRVADDLSTELLVQIPITSEYEQLAKAYDILARKVIDE